MKKWLSLMLALSLAASLLVSPAAAAAAPAAGNGGTAAQASQCLVAYNSGDSRHFVYMDEAPAGLYTLKAPADIGLAPWGLAFEGWRMEGTTSVYGPGDVINLTGHVSLYATWINCFVEFKVGSISSEYYCDAGTVIALPSMENGVVKLPNVGASISVPVPEGRAIVGWKSSILPPWQDSPVPGEEYISASHCVINDAHVVFEPIWTDDLLDCTVTYQVDGRSFSFLYRDSDVRRQEIDLKDISDFGYIKPPKGKQFGGWTNIPDGTEILWTSADTYMPGNGDLTLYPVWEDTDTVHIFYSSYNGTTGEQKIISMTPKEARKDAVLPTPEALGFTTPTGKEFDHWTIGVKRYAPGDTFTPRDNGHIDAIWRDVTPINVPDFTDVPTNHWALEQVKWAVANRITTGMGDGTFAPDATCTNAQIISMLWSAAGKPVVGTVNPYIDVPQGAWYYNAALWAYRRGIVTSTSFRPNDQCTRAAAVQYLWKQAGSPEEGQNVFYDIPTSAPYRQAVAWAVENEIASGMGDGSFAPNSICSRAQIISFLYNAANN